MVVLLLVFLQDQPKFAGAQKGMTVPGFGTESLLDEKRKPPVGWFSPGFHFSFPENQQV